MAESGGNYLCKGRAQRAAAIGRARLDPEVGGAMSARQMTDFMNDRTLLRGDEQQHQAQHSVQVTHQSSRTSATPHMQKLTESATNCSIHASSSHRRTRRPAPDAIG